jgi:hypothetical protein
MCRAGPDAEEAAFSCLWSERDQGAVCADQISRSRIRTSVTS